MPINVKMVGGEALCARSNIPPAQTGGLKTFNAYLTRSNGWETVYNSRTSPPLLYNPYSIR
jgi:hypothetical protein